MGINIPTRDELIANRLDLQQLAEYIGWYEVCASDVLLLHLMFN